MHLIKLHLLRYFEFSISSFTLVNCGFENSKSLESSVFLDALSKSNSATEGFDDYGMLPYIIAFIIGINLFRKILLAVLGHVKLTFDKKGGEIHSGILDLGSSKGFEWQNTSRVLIQDSSFTNNKQPIFEIAIKGVKNITFGERLNDDQRLYIKNAIERLLVKYNN